MVAKLAPTTPEKAPCRVFHGDIRPARIVDGVPIGVDIQAHYKDVEKLARSFFRQCGEVFRAAARSGHAGRRVEVDDFVQDVALTVHRLNSKPSAFDRSKGTFGRWVWFVCRSVASHGTEKVDLDTLYTDPEDIGHASAGSPGLSAGVRAYLEDNEAGLRSAARRRKMAEMIGQTNLFTITEEWPALAAAAEEMEIPHE